MAGEKRIKLQSAIEFLTTYGWAIIIISVVLVIFYEMGFFNFYNLVGGAPPGSCRVYRPYGPNSTSYVSLQGVCTPRFPEFIAEFNGQSSSVSVPNLFPKSVCTMTLTAWSYYRGMQSNSIGGVVGGCSTPGCVSADAQPPGGYVGIGYNESILVFMVGNASIGSTYFVPRDFEGRWIFTAFTLNNGVASTYLNGALTSSFSNNVPVCMNTTTWQIGNLAQMYDGATHFNGIITNIQIYNTSLTANDILAMYAGGIGNEPIDLYHLVAWYTLNSNGYDYSGDYYNGSTSNIGFLGNWYNTYPPIMGPVPPRTTLRPIFSSTTSTSTSSTSTTSTSTTSTTATSTTSTSSTSTTLTSTSSTSTALYYSTTLYSTTIYYSTTTITLTCATATGGSCRSSLSCLTICAQEGQGPPVCSPLYECSACCCQGCELPPSTSTTYYSTTTITLTCATATGGSCRSSLSCLTLCAQQGQGSPICSPLYECSACCCQGCEPSASASTTTIYSPGYSTTTIYSPGYSTTTIYSPGYSTTTIYSPGYSTTLYSSTTFYSTTLYSSTLYSSTTFYSTTLYSTTLYTSTVMPRQCCSVCVDGEIVSWWCVGISATCSSSPYSCGSGSVDSTPCHVSGPCYAA